MDRFIRGWPALVARSLPAKHVTDRITPWIALVAAIIGGGAGLWEYADKNKAERVRRVLDSYTAYIKEDAGKSLKGDLRLALDTLVPLTTVRCTWMKERAKDLSAIAESTGGLPTASAVSQIDCADFDARSKLYAIALRDSARTAIRAAVDKEREQLLKKDPQTKYSAVKVLDFFNSIIACVNSNGCDNTTAYSIFAGDMVDLLNGFCRTFDERARAWNDKPKDVEVARFLVQNGARLAVLGASSDKNRRHLFYCEHLHKVER